MTHNMPAGDMSATARPPTTTLSGLSDDEARGFHRAFILSFIGFTLVAAIAHWAAWQWRPWIPGVEGYPVAAPAGATAPAGVAPIGAATSTGTATVAVLIPR